MNAQSRTATVIVEQTLASSDIIAEWRSKDIGHAKSRQERESIS